MASNYLKLYEDYLREEKHASENTLIETRANEQHKLRKNF